MGVYRTGEHFWAETLTLHRDGSFVFEQWADDGGTLCRAEGSWTELADHTTIVTSVKRVLPAERGNCAMPAVERWRRGHGALRSSSGKELKRESGRDQVPDATSIGIGP